MSQSPGDAVSDCFFSYKRDDNAELYEVVDRIRRDLSGLYAAHTGKTLRIFLDRESIGWGADWQQRIREAVESATAFIPIITMRYFTSPACSEELLLFFNNAKQLGVTELLLPIVIAGASNIRDTDEREEVRIIASRNYANLQEPWLAGYGSSEWRRAIFKLVTDLDDALTSAEEALASREQSPDDTSGGAGADPDPPSDPASEVDALELQGRIEELSALLQRTMRSLEKFSTITTKSLSGDFPSLSRNQQMAVLARLAKQIGPVSQALGQQGQALKMATASIDVDLRALMQAVESIDSTTFAPSALFGDLAGLSELDGVVASMDELLSMMKVAALMSVSLRKALRPATDGIQAIRTATMIVRGWSGLAS
jgi:hypothetical protein